MRRLARVRLDFPGWGCRDGGAAVKVASIEGVTEYRLANGARVLLFPEASRPTVTVNMTVLVGSRHEGYGESGMAHLLEHMVFKGTPYHPEVPKALRDHGASFNGTTNSDRTNYFETMPATDENLEFGIALECDRLVNSFVKARGPAVGNDGRPQRVRARREQPRLDPQPADLRRGLRMAQLRQVHDRQPLRHRTRAHRKPAGLLQEVLSAG